MEKSIYICSTYYHVLIALVRSIDELNNWDILITNYISNRFDLAKRLKQNDTFNHVYVTREVKEYVPKNKFDAIFFARKKNAVKLEKELPVDLRRYKNICAFHDDIWVTHYMKTQQISYCLLEDALNSFVTITESPFSYMIPKHNLKSWIKKSLNLQYRFWGECKYVKMIEVNSKSGLQIPLGDKVIEYPRKSMFSRLKNEDENKILHVFLPEMNFSCESECVILLTQPLYEDGLVENEEVQKAIYQYIMNHYTDKGDVIFIKPHPRDNVIYDYNNVNILYKDFPVEILNFQKGIYFKKAVTAFSTAIDSLTFINEKVSLGVEKLNIIKKEVKEYGEL